MAYNDAAWFVGLLFLGTLPLLLLFPGKRATSTPGGERRRGGPPRAGVIISGRGACSECSSPLARIGSLHPHASARMAEVHGGTMTLQVKASALTRSPRYWVMGRDETAALQPTTRRRPRP